MKRIFLLPIALLIMLGGFFVTPNHAAAAVCPSNTNAIRVVTRDWNGELLPGMNVQVVNKLTNPDGDPYLGPSVLAQATTDAGGQTSVLCVPSARAPYAIKVYQKNPTFGYSTYWDIYEGGNTEISTVDVMLGGFQVIFRDAQGTLLKDIVFDVFLQSFDIDGKAIIDVTKLNADKLVASDFNTRAFGNAFVYLTPGSYVIRVHGTGNSYFYLWNQEVNAEEETYVEYLMGTMRFVFEDGFGRIVKNQKFTIHKQGKDVRGNPYLGTVVAANLSTGEIGKYDAHLPKGTYALSISGTGGSRYKSYNYRIAPEEYKYITYRMSGVRIVLRGADGDLARNTRFSFASQTRDALGRPIVKTTLVRSRTTGEAGYVDVYVPAGEYMMVVGTQRLTQIDVFDKQFTSVDWPRTITFRPSAELSVVTPIANTNFIVRRMSPRTLPSYLGAVQRVTGVYKVTAENYRRSAYVVMTASQSNLEKFDVRASRLKMAYYNARTKRWSFVGRRYSSARQVRANIPAPGYVTLVASY